ncbi:MAG: YraN family protein [Chloroflexi bacterium]|nr:YraN family protein [Chloroflexota bacterium]MYF81673.1 YraN family protein [Chloroflexota bacterium]MYI04569.1 YraN family protein [Chloroflexota bacterium]
MPPEPDHRRRLGAAGEEVAARYLAARGYEIVERNYRRRWGEADIIALAEDGTHVIVEVRSRSNRRYAVEAAQSIGPRKQRQLLRMAQGLIAEHGTELDVRIDVMIVAPDRSGQLSVVAHIVDAIEGS